MSTQITCDYCKKPITVRNDLTVGFFIIPLPFHNECFGMRTKSFPGVFLKNTPLNSWRYSIMTVLVMLIVIFMYTVAFSQYGHLWIIPLALLVIVVVSYPRWLSYVMFESKLPSVKSNKSVLLTAGWLKDNRLYCAYCLKEISNADQLVTARKLLGITVFPLHNACFSAAIRTRSEPLISSAVINSKEFKIRYMNTLGISAFITTVIVFVIILKIYTEGFSAGILYLFIAIIVLSLIVFWNYMVRNQGNAWVNYFK